MYKLFCRVYELWLKSKLLMLADAFIVFLSVICAVLVLNLPFLAEEIWPEAFKTAVVMSVFYCVSLMLWGCYSSLWRYAQAKEFFHCFVAGVIAGLCGFAFWGLAPKILPPYFYVVANLTSMLLILGSRLCYKYYRDFAKQKNTAKLVDKEQKQRTLIIGGGTACLMLLNEVLRRGDSRILPLTIVDQDERKKGRNIGGLKIEGGMEDLPTLCERYKIQLIIVAIPSANNRQRAEILEKCADLRVKVQMLPYLSSFYEGGSGIVDKLRDIMPEELLGRDEVALNCGELMPFFKDKTVIVTGGGGSIGSELCRQIALYKPKSLIILDIYENNAYEIQQELLRRYGGSLKLEILIASVRDKQKINRIFESYKPNIVFHAAAHKHVPLMELSPDEAIKNNIFGTQNLVMAAIKHKVEKFILISTDKAVNPTNIMGATKRVCEMICESGNGLSATVFAAVRFGNVLGSNGSVIPLFKKQIADGGPVTVTHPDIIRYFMTIPEAAKLVLTAGAMAKGGELFILDMGKPVKIDDLAKKMIGLAGLSVGKDIEINYIGLRPGEKLYEELLLKEESYKKTSNKNIFIADTVKTDPNALKQKLDRLKESCDNAEAFDSKQAEAVLRELVPTFCRYYGQ